MKAIKAKTILSYLVGSFAFLLLPFIFSPDFMFSFDMFYNRHVLRELTGYILILMFFYLHYFFLIPELYFKKKYALFLVAVLVCFIIQITIPKTIFPFERGHHHSFPGHFPVQVPILMDIGHHLFIFLLVIFVSFNIKMNSRLKQARKEKSEAELLYLKAQINPHFLFNSLNSIYSLAIAKSDQAPHAVVMLSGLMRYVLTEAHQEFVFLSKEMEYITDYIELQKIRLGNTIKINFQINGQFQDKKIGPLLLIPFVENAFKYGVNAEENSEISVVIDLDKTFIRMEAVNNKVTTHVEEKDKAGVGIENTKSRLELLYPHHHILSIYDGPEKYRVLLQIKLT